MRVTAKTKEATRQRLLEAARRLLLRDGWSATTTRAIATEAGTATGTLFNYFSTKEVMAAELLVEALRAAEREYEERRRGDESLEEDLFAWVWSGLRQLVQYRGVLGEALGTLLSPIARPGDTPKDAAPERDDPGAPLRSLQLRALERLAAQHGAARALSPVLVQLYWTLYLGVLAHWAADRSPHQEDALALLDQSLISFCAALNQAAS